MRQGAGDGAGVGLLLDPSVAEAKVALRMDFTRVSQDKATPLLASIVPTRATVARDNESGGNFGCQYDRCGVSVFARSGPF
jgi:hypothetical protein